MSHLATPRDSVPAAAHLIRLLEKQPACLMRVSLDGVLLATNDAAMSLLGATQLSQVLNTALTERLVPAHRALWRDFADRVWKDASGSVECDMVDLSGACRTVQVQAVALADHPDGIKSVLAAVRDVSVTRHLEVTLQEYEKALPEHEAGSQLASVLRAQLEAALAEGAATARAMDALRAQLEQSKADGLRLEMAAHQAGADRHRLESAIEQRDAEGQQLRSALDESLAEREEFESTLKQREANRQRLLAEHATARVRAESALAEAASHGEQLTQLHATRDLDVRRTEENARRLESLAAAGQLALDASRAEQAEAVRATEAVRLQLEQSKADRLRLETAAQQDKADRQRLESAIEQRDANRRQLQSMLDEALAERQEFESAMKQRDANRQRLLAEHASARVRVESALAEATSHNEQLMQLLADQRLDLQRTEENARRLESLAAAGQLALNASLDERTEAALAMEALRAQLEQSSADRLGLEAAIGQREADRQRIQSMLDESLAGRQEFESALNQREVSRQRLLAEHASARARVEIALAETASRNEQLTKLLADQGLDLQRTDENARRLESLAAAGRLALEVARELQMVMAALDVRAKDLLGKCPLEADERKDMEIFRSDAIRAASLVRQIVQAERMP